MLRGDTGNLGERIARQHYAKSGFSIIASNFFNKVGKRRGELDFVARRGQLITFVEVKCRVARAGAYQSAVESVDLSKKRKLLKVIRWFLANHPEFTDSRLRIDVCVVILDKTANYVRILSNAVEDLY